jgi:flagellar motor switch protein FliN/FliY
METSAIEHTVEAEVPHKDAWAHVMELPCCLSVEVKVPHFTVGDLLRLAVSSLVDTRHHDGSHVPIRVNGQMIAWGEFDVIDDRLAVRLTELV